MNSLSGKVILILGGGGKFGRACCDFLVAQGSLVITINRRPSKSGSAVVEYVANLDSVEEVRNCAVKIKNAFGSLDGIINLAVHRPMTDFFASDISKWEESTRVNGNVLYLTATVLIDRLMKDGGSYVYVGSIYSITAPRFDIYEGEDFETEPDYPFVKGGGIMFTKYMAAKFGARGIRCNSVCFGGIDNGLSEAFKKKYASNTLLGRMAKVTEVPGPIGWLLSDYSSYVTGSTIMVDGGWSAI